MGGSVIAEISQDCSNRPHDRAWLNYQKEIGLRHTPPIVPLR
jgi:hypothetical protein